MVEEKKTVWMALATQDSEADGDARKLVGRSREDQGVFNPSTWKQEHCYQQGPQSETESQKQNKMLLMISMANRCVFGSILPLSVPCSVVQCHRLLPDPWMIVENKGHESRREMAALGCGRAHTWKEEPRTE